MHRVFVTFGFAAAVAFLVGGCHERHSASTMPSAAELAALPEPPPPARGSAPSQEDIMAVRAAVAELVRRADANDEAYFAGLMPGAEPAAATDMMHRVKRVDMNGNYAKHLVMTDAATARLDYHDPAHFQVDLKRPGAAWTVTRLWFCR
jgi:hypothetical protein